MATHAILSPRRVLKVWPLEPPYIEWTKAGMNWNSQIYIYISIYLYIYISIYLYISIDNISIDKISLNRTFHEVGGSVSAGHALIFASKRNCSLENFVASSKSVFGAVEAYSETIQKWRSLMGISWNIYIYIYGNIYMEIHLYKYIYIIIYIYIYMDKIDEECQARVF